MGLRRVVVTGLGAITPLGHTVPETWNNMLNGVSGSGLITHYDTTKFKTKFACEIKNYDSTAYFDRKEARKLDRFAQYALIGADEAIKDSGLDLESINLHRVGVILASGIGGVETLLNEIKGFLEGDGTPRFSPFFIPKIICDIAAGHISMKYGFMGPNYATVSACASGSNAIIDAVELIRNNRAEVIVAGGSEAAINVVGMGGFNAMQAISTRNDEYKTASRPFCATRDGFVMGEGSGSLIFEEYEHAKARGANIYAEVVGVGMSADAYHIAAPHPEGIGAFHVMKNALEDANLDCKQVDYINVHGTATPRGDLAELFAIKRLFGDHAYKLNISATKSMTGHLLGAAGALEAIVNVLSIRDDIIPPTINHVEKDPEIDEKLNLTLHKAQKRKVNVAMTNTFGFGGHNTTIIFKKFE